MMPGIALDITVDDDTGQPYDFSVQAQRNKAEASHDAQEPALLIGSPMYRFLRDPSDQQGST